MNSRVGITRVVPRGRPERGQAPQINAIQESFVFDETNKRFANRLSRG